MTDLRRELHVRLVKAGTIRREEQSMVSLDDAVLRMMYVRMVQIRAFEIRLTELQQSEHIAGVSHSIGLEAAAVGACFSLRDEDVILCSGRPIGQLLAKGANPRNVLAEILGRVDGTAGGNAGGQQLSDFAHGALGSFRGGRGLAIAAGVALGFQLQRNDRIVLAFVDDGGVDSRQFADFAKLATSRKPPLVIVQLDSALGGTSAPDEGSWLVELAAGHGMTGAAVDGGDPVAVFHAVGEAVGRARAGEGTSIIETRVFPLRDDRGTPEQDPVAALAKRLRAIGTLTGDDEQSVEQKARDDVAEALAWASAKSTPPSDAVYQRVYSQPVEHNWPLLEREAIDG